MRRTIVWVFMLAVLSTTAPEAADAVKELAKLVPDPPVAEVIGDDEFGNAVAISNNTVVIGVEDADVIGFATGAVNVYRILGLTWLHLATLLPSEYHLSGRFGSAVAIDGDTIAVGARTEGDAGAAYVFSDTSPGGNWSSYDVLRVTPNSAAGGASFGSTIALAGPTLAVGAPNDDQGGLDAGAAYVFHDTLGDWSVVTQTLLVPVGQPAGSDAGSSIAATEDTVFVGVPDGDGGITTSGAVLVYRDTSGGTWSTTAQRTLAASDGAAYDDFGSAVACEGTTLVVGAREHDAAGSRYGAVYVLRDTSAGSDWSSVAETKLLPTAATTRYLGGSVSIDDRYVHAGSGYRGSGDEVLVFEDTSAAGDWSTHTETVLTFDGGAEFGDALAGDNMWLVAGAPFHDAAGVDAGSVVIFTDSPGGWIEAEALDCTGHGDVGGMGFGTATALHGDTAAVAVVGVNGFPGQLHLSRDIGGWQDLTTLSSSNADEGDFFGWEIDLDGRVAIAGAPLRDTPGVVVFVDDSAAGDWGSVTERFLDDPTLFYHTRVGWSVAMDGRTIVAGAPSDRDVENGGGAVYAFRDTSAAGDWSTSTTTKIITSDVDSYDGFGWEVAVQGTTIAAANSYMYSAAAVYVLEDTSGLSDWSSYNETRLDPIEADSDFGISLSVDGDAVAVGAANANGGRGAVYLYHDPTGTGAWGQVSAQEVIDSNGSIGDWFGSSVVLDGNTLVVGSQEREVAGPASGTVLVFQDSSAASDWSWLQLIEVSPADGFEHDHFGYDVALDGSTIVAASIWDDDSGPDNGSAYIYAFATALFGDGFESGDTSGWSHAVP